MWQRESLHRREIFTSSQRGSTERRGRGVELTCHPRGASMSWRGSAHAATTSPSTGTAPTFSTGKHRHHRSPGRHKDTQGNLSTTSSSAEIPDETLGFERRTNRGREDAIIGSAWTTRCIIAGSTNVPHPSSRLRREWPESKGDGGGDYSLRRMRGIQGGGGDAVNWLGCRPIEPGRSSLNK
jgi:hypothetical protein